MTRMDQKKNDKNTKRTERKPYLPPCIEAEDDLSAESLLNFLFADAGGFSNTCTETTCAFG